MSRYSFAPLAYASVSCVSAVSAATCAGVGGGGGGNVLLVTMGAAELGPVSLAAGPAPELPSEEEDAALADADGADDDDVAGFADADVAGFADAAGCGCAM
ncbi:MAG: hypothetical protein ACRELY_12720, partial [Polyangiaceae bacterium]